MLGRRRQLAEQARGRTPNDVVAVCKAYSERLKAKPVRVKLHVSLGRIADGTIGLVAVDGAPAHLVVQAQGSNLFGLVKREIKHVFKVGELERSRSTHTAFLLRSIKHLAKGNVAMKEELLAKSLSLVRKNEAVDLTFATEKECNNLGDWIDAKWSVAMIQKSFRGNPRINLALQGKNQTLNDQGVYEALEKSGDNRRRKGGRLRRRRDEVDGAGFGRLPVLDPPTKSNLQDDLLNGVHVTYHDLSLRGFLSTSTPRRLRFDCKSKAGLVYLEPSFEGDGQTIVQPVSSLIQVGGGPSAHGPTSSLLRATGDNKEQRATAVSLVFSEKSMDLTCGSEKDAVELVLFFSELRGFTRAKPPDQSMLCVSPVEHAAPDHQTKEATRDLGVHGGAGGGGVGGHRGETQRAGAVYNAGAAMLNMSSATEALDVHDALGRSAPPMLAARAAAKAKAEAEEEPTAAASDAADPLGSSAPSFSTRFRSGYGKGDDAAAALLERQLSAASGFRASDSLRKISAAAARRSNGGGVAQQRVWATHRGATSSPSAADFIAESIAAGAPAFQSTPGPARRPTMDAAVESLDRSRGGQPQQRRRAEGAGEKREEERPRGQRYEDHARQRAPAPGDAPPPPYRSPPAYPKSPPTYEASGGAGVSAFTAVVHQDRRGNTAVGELPRRRGKGMGKEAAAEPVAAVDSQVSPPSRSKSPVSRSRSPASRHAPKEATRGGGGDGNCAGTDGHHNRLSIHPQFPGHARGPAAACAPPLPAREGGGGGDVDDSDRQQQRVNLHAVFPTRARGPVPASAPPAPARGGVPGGGDGGSNGHHRANLHSQFPGRARGPAATSSVTAAAPAAASSTAGREEGRNAIPRRSGRSPARQPAPFSSAAEMRASTSVADPAGSATGSDVDRSATARGGRGRRHAHGRPELGDLEDDENYTTVRVKGTTPSPTSSDIEKSGYGRRRSSTPTKDRRHRKGSGLTKTLRGKLFASSQGSSGSGTPSSVSPVPGRGSGGVGRGFGSSLETSSSGSGSARTRVAAFLTNPRGGMTSVGGVEDFNTSPSPTKASGASRFRSSPA